MNTDLHMAEVRPAIFKQEQMLMFMYIFSEL